MTWEAAVVVVLIAAFGVLALVGLVLSEVRASREKRRIKEQWEKAASEYPVGLRIGAYRVQGHEQGRPEHPSPDQRYAGVLVRLYCASVGGSPTLVHVPYPSMGGLVIQHSEEEA